MPDKWDWDLRSATGSFKFGDDYSEWVVERWDISDAPLRTDDISVPRGDGVMFGQDFRDAPTVTFDLWSHVDSEDDARAALSRLMRAWDAPDVRSRGGSTVELAHPNGRLLVGRPRKIAPSNVNRVERGRIAVTAAFEASFTDWFSPGGSAVVGLVPPLGRGLVAPLVEPLTIQGASYSAAGITVGGELPVYPIIEFRGPITNPQLDGPGWSLKTRVNLAYDETLRVDTRPWVRALSLNGRPAAGLLMPNSDRLRDVMFETGFHSVQLRGVDATGTSSALVTWQESYASF